VTSGDDRPVTGTPAGAGDDGVSAAHRGPGDVDDWPTGGSGRPPRAPGQVPGAPVAPREPTPAPGPPPGHQPAFVTRPDPEPERAERPQAAPAERPQAAPGPPPPPPPDPVPQRTEQIRRPAPAAPAVGTATATRPVTVGVAAQQRRGGRRARLTVKRIDPWSTLKFAFVYSLAGLVVLLVAVIALYAIVDAMGVIESMRSFLEEIEGTDGGSIADWLGFGRVLTVTLVLGAVNVILFTAFATLTAFIYNVCTDLVGGVEVTLADRT
jgi:hypothetical protein